MNARCDIAVVGAGMVGAAAAALLARSGFRVDVIEAGAAPRFEPQAEIGLRVSALSPGSQAVLAEAGAWAGIAAARHCPYRRMQVEDRDAGAVVGFTAPEFGLERLGTIVENDLVAASLWAVLRSDPLVRLHPDAALEQLEPRADGVRLGISGGTHLTASLVLGADGATSRVRTLCGLRQDHWEYPQHAVVAVVRTAEPNPGIAWQRFLDGGPLAFLPLADGRSSIVWSLPAASAAGLLAADAAEFTAALDSASAGWLGQVTGCGPRAGFALQMRLGERLAGPRVALLGDAAQQVHPLAGQGVNLGLADAAALVETLLEARAAGEDPATLRRLEGWARWRGSEDRLMAAGIHGISALFDGPALAPLRRLGMGLVGRSWFVREAFVRRAAGLDRRAPRLARGASLAGLRHPGI